MRLALERNKIRFRLRHLVAIYRELRTRRTQVANIIRERSIELESAIGRLPCVAQRVGRDELYDKRSLLIFSDAPERSRNCILIFGDGRFLVADGGRKFSYFEIGRSDFALSYFDFARKLFFVRA